MRKLFYQVSDLENVLGNYTLADGLQDLADMVDVLLSTDLLSSVLPDLPELTKIIQWIGKMVQFGNGLDGDVLGAFKV